MKAKNRWLIISASLLLLLLLAFFLYTGSYYRATDTAIKALESDSVQIEETAYGWFFDGPSDERALVFYPGAKVEETAYAPLLHLLAGRGVDVFLIKMPFHLAFFGMNTADDIIEQHNYRSWYIGGHSLGGVIAANYASAHNLAGVILLASYPIRDVEEPILILYGSEDGILTRSRVTAASQFGTVEEFVLEGGNHAGFGEYGEQKGDRPALIPSEEQQKTAVDRILVWLSGHKNPEG